MPNAPLTAHHYRRLATATRAFSQFCIDPAVGAEYVALAETYDVLADHLDHSTWAYRAEAA